MKEFGQFLSLAQGSLAELETQVVLSVELKGLFDYAKFHIGLYTGLISLLVGIAKFMGQPKEMHLGWLKCTLVLLVLAGICGGVVGSNTYEYDSFDKFKDAPIGSFGWKPFSGKTWAHCEHSFFWAAVILATTSVLFQY